jgi:signal transduction histidine kinase
MANESEDMFLQDISNILMSNMNILLQNLQEKTREIDRIVFLRSNAIENTKLDLDLKKNNLKHILEKVIDIYQIGFGHKIRIYEMHFLSLIEEFVFDKERIFQVIDNLLSNATRFTLEGMIIIEVENDLNYVYISIKDSGSGIRPDEMQHIFELGFKGKDSFGHGVGLYFVNKVIEAHGGDIKVKSKYGKGTEFKISLKLDLNEN